MVEEPAILQAVMELEMRQALQRLLRKVSKKESGKS